MQGSSLRVQNSGCMIYGSCFKAQGLGYRVKGGDFLELRVQFMIHFAN